MKILVCDEISEKGLSILKAIPHSSVDVRTKLSEAELIKVIPGYEAAVVRSATRITSQVLEAGKKLKVVARAGMGYDNIDIDTATKRGVVVMNTPGANSVATAEHTIAMMMALARHIPQAHRSMTSGKWEKKDFVGTEFLGKTLA